MPEGEPRGSLAPQARGPSSTCGGRWFSRSGGKLQAGREHAGRIAEFDERPALVEREEVPCPVTEFFGNEAGVVRECFGGVTVFPSAAILQRLRQVPVVKRRERRNAVGEQLVDQPVIVLEPLCVGAPVPCGKMRGQEIENRYARAPSVFIDCTSSLYR